MHEPYGPVMVLGGSNHHAQCMPGREGKRGVRERGRNGGKKGREREREGSRKEDSHKQTDKWKEVLSRIVTGMEGKTANEWPGEECQLRQSTPTNPRDKRGGEHMEAHEDVVKEIGQQRVPERKIQTGICETPTMMTHINDAQTRRLAGSYGGNSRKKNTYNNSAAKAYNHKHVNAITKPFGTSFVACSPCLHVLCGSRVSISASSSFFGVFSRLRLTFQTVRIGLSGGEKCVVAGGGGERARKQGTWEKGMRSRKEQTKCSRLARTRTDAEE